jgi:predicted PurR-regulated permease PerM
VSPNLRYIVGFLGLVVLGFALWYFQNVVIYLIISVVISIIGGPLVTLLKKIKFGTAQMPSSLAAGLTILTFLGLIYAFLNVFAPLIAEEASTLNAIDVNELANNIETRYNGVMDTLSGFNLSGDERSNEIFIVDQIKQFVSFGDLQQVFNNIFGFLGNALIAFFSILFMSFFFLRDGHLFDRIVLTISPDKHMDKVKNIMHSSRLLLTRYFLGLLIQVSIVTLLVTLGLSIIGVKNAFLIGFLAGLFNLIPYIGPIIGAIIAMLIAITSNLSIDLQPELTPKLLKIAAVFATIQLLDNFIFQPYIFSNSVHAHPLEIFIVISLAGALGGIGGMIIAIPAYTLIRIVAGEFLSKFKIVQSLTRNLDGE